MCLKILVADCSNSKLHNSKGCRRLLCCAGACQQTGPIHVGSCNQSSYRVPGRFRIRGYTYQCAYNVRFQFSMCTTRNTCRWCPPALVLPIETRRIAVPASCTHFQSMKNFESGMGKPGTRESCWTGATVLTAIHSLTLQTCWRRLLQQRSLCTCQMRRLDIPARF